VRDGSECRAVMPGAMNENEIRHATSCGMASRTGPILVPAPRYIATSRVPMMMFMPRPAFPPVRRPDGVTTDGTATFTPEQLHILWITQTPLFGMADRTSLRRPRAYVSSGL